MRAATHVAAVAAVAAAMMLPLLLLSTTTATSLGCHMVAEDTTMLCGVRVDALTLLTKRKNRAWPKENCYLSIDTLTKLSV